MTLLPRRLVQRVAWATSAAIAIGAGSVALVSGFLGESFAQRREQQQLLNAASVLAQELVEPGVDPLFIAADEARELKPAGIRVAVYEGTRLFAGDARIPGYGTAGCWSEPEVTICSVGSHGFFGVVARGTTHLREQRRSVVISSLLAVALTSLLGALFARRIALRLVAPLSRLGAAVERVPADAPENADVGDDEGVEEVDLLRGTLRATFARLGHSLATSRRFAADAAHELRTPLTVIRGQLELSAPLVGEEARESVERARATTARLSTLVERLLVLATPAAKLDLGEELDLPSVVDGALDLLPTSAWSRVEVSSESEALVRGDRALLASMVGNALENALKFSERAIRVRLRAAGTYAQIEVEDDGPGIPEADRERVFEPFFRTRAARASGTRGHGVGLSLIAHVATMHGGRVRLLPRERGTCLLIELPLTANG